MHSCFLCGQQPPCTKCGWCDPPTGLICSRGRSRTRGYLFTNGNKFSFPCRPASDRTEVAGAEAGAALDAAALIDQVLLARLAGDTVHRTGAAASATAHALLGEDGIAHQRAADACTAIALLYVLNILIAEVAQGREHRVGRRLPQPAQAAALDGVRQLFQLVKVVRCRGRRSCASGCPACGACHRGRGCICRTTPPG